MKQAFADRNAEQAASLMQSHLRSIESHLDFQAEEDYYVNLEELFS